MGRWRLSIYGAPVCVADRYYRRHEDQYPSNSVAVVKCWSFDKFIPKLSKLLIYDVAQIQQQYSTETRSPLHCISCTPFCKRNNGGFICQTQKKRGKKTKIIQIKLLCGHIHNAIAVLMVLGVRARRQCTIYTHCVCNGRKKRYTERSVYIRVYHIPTKPL